MLKRNALYIVVILCLFAGVVYLEVVKPKPLDWELYFDRHAETPYGGYLLYENLPNLFPGQEIGVSNHEIRHELRRMEDRQETNFIILNEIFDPDTADSRALLEWVAEGNNAFIAANDYYGAFADELGITTENLYSEQDYEWNDREEERLIPHGTKQAANINFEEFGVKADTAYEYKRNVTNYYFTTYNNARVTILGRDESDGANFLRIKYGNGHIFLHSMPRVFGNYFVSDPVNHEYVFKALSYLPVTKTIWDEHYKLERNISGSPLRFIFQHAALTWAFWILIGTMGLFVLFNAKRTQRVVPIIPPLSNTTVEFVDIISQLYYNQGNHRNLAHKKIHFFLESIRTKYQMRTNMIDDAFLTKLHTRSGVPIELVQEVFQTIGHYNHSRAVSDRDLYYLNEKIEEFYAHSER